MDKSTIRIIETKQEEEQNAKNMKFFCSLCYLTIKADLTTEKKRKEKERISRSVPKKEKPISYEPRTLATTKKDPFSQYESPSNDVNNLIKNKLNQSPTLSKRCKNCFSLM